MTERKKHSAEHEICFAHIEEMMPLIEESLAAGQSVKLSPTGVSMRPMLRQERDCVVLSPAPERLCKYDIPLYKRENGQYVLHRVVRVGKDYTCTGDNQFVYEHGIRQEQVIAVVTAFTRDEKQISVHAFSYRLYCRLWHWTRFPRHVWRAVNRRLRRFVRRMKKS